jgi:plasmid maintenance system antidote protein VapI
MNIGKSMKIALLKNNMDQSGLAQTMEVHVSAISRISCNKTITTETLERVAKALKMKVSEFVALGED